MLLRIGESDTVFSACSMLGLLSQFDDSLAMTHLSFLRKIRRSTSLKKLWRWSLTIDETSSVVDASIFEYWMSSFVGSFQRIRVFCGP